MGGFFGTIAVKECVNDLFYGTDYNSHLGTKRAGLVTFDKEKGFTRSIHSLERDYFRSGKKEEDTEAAMTEHRNGILPEDIPSADEIAQELMDNRMHFSEMSANNINPTELVALLINMGDTFVEGINLVYRKVKGSCSMLILTEDGIIAVRDPLGRTPIVIGQKDGALAATSETTALPNLDYKRLRDVGPGEIVRLRTTGPEVLQKPMNHCQICSFLTRAWEQP